MTTCFLAPDPIQSTQFIPGGNTPANGGQLFFYAASSTTKQTVYKDSAAGSAWSNPIVLDSGGNLPNGGEVWFVSGQTYKVVFAPATDTDPPVSPYWTKDNLAGMNDTSGSQSEWVTGPTPTFVSGSQFTLSGDQTGTFTKARRVKFSVTAGTVYGVITSSSFSVNTTTVNMAFDSGALDSGLTAVSYSLVTPNNSSIGPDYIYKNVTSVASAGTGTTNIWGVAGDYVHITGTNTIASFSSAPYAGAARTIIFDGALSLNHSGNLRVPGAANVTTAANDRALIRADTTTSAILTFYTKESGLSITKVRTRTVLTTSSQALTSSGTYSIPSGCITLNIRLAGGGGGGSGSGTGGNGGGGTATTFSSATASLTGSGGSGGVSTAVATFNGGIGTGGDINFNGGSGAFGMNAANGQGGAGGNSAFGGGSGGQWGLNGTGQQGASNTGSGGGGGGGTAAVTGGNGGGAGGYVEKLITSPSTSYVYTIGAGGTAGASGGNAAGGAGAAGIIIIDEYYL